jgi:hypothetical protein
MIVMNMVTPKAVAKNEPLFNKVGQICSTPKSDLRSTTKYDNIDRNSCLEIGHTLSYC